VTNDDFNTENFLTKSNFNFLLESISNKIINE